MKNSFGAVILAAGQGTRMKLETPKPLAPLLGKRLVDYSICETASFFQKADVYGRIGIVTGYMREDVETYIDATYRDYSYPINFAYQEKQLGTADALRAYFQQIKDAEQNEYTIILCADTPLIQSDDFVQMFEKVKKEKLEGIAATFNLDNPKGYGRIIRSSNELGFHIVEQKDADHIVDQITEVNSGLYIFKTSFIKEHLEKVDCNNKSGEFYLTDLFRDHYKVAAMRFDDYHNFMGVNTLEQLEESGNILRGRKAGQLRDLGVRFIDSSSVYIDWDVQIGEGTIIYPQVSLQGKTTIGANCCIEQGVIVKDSFISNDVNIKGYSYFEEARVNTRATVGPFARLRKGSNIGEESKIGNFVEIKKAKLDKGVKVSHLSYVGDAEIGEETNIGCGFITCNYDGANKHMTKIGKKCFIGSDSQMVAPVELGDECFVASGSTITNSMSDGAFAISRGKQVTKEGMASRFIKNKK
jgi:bifunctional UDP-N-acetylglucosamine pyrophosphorylase/glucosamine-1-phosphate N-acetyltransferase